MARQTLTPSQILESANRMGNAMEEQTAAFQRVANIVSNLTSRDGGMYGSVGSAAMNKTLSLKQNADHQRARSAEVVTSLSGYAKEMAHDRDQVASQMDALS